MKKRRLLQPVDKTWYKYSYEMTVIIGEMMAILSFKVGHVYCYDCVKGVGKFLGKIKGVRSVEVKNNDSAVIDYDPAGLDIDEEQFKKIARETIERLGFRIKQF